MFEALSNYETIVLLTGLIGVYIKLNSDSLKLRGRVEGLEKSDNDVKSMLTTLLDSVNEIKILLAHYGITK